MNAIVRRELLSLLRTRKAIAAQVVLAGACALLVLVRWPTEGTADLAGARSLQVLRVFGYGLLTGLLLLGPAAPAVSLVGERVKGTLALLLNAPLSPGAIYLGKLTAVLGFAGTLLLMTAPAAAACHALGGTATRAGVVLLYLVLAAAAVQTATLGLFVSSRSVSIDGALRATYGLVLAVVLIPPVPHWLLRGTQGPEAVAADWARCLSPVPAVMEVLGQRDAGSHGFGGTGGTVARYLLLAAVMSLGCAGLTVLRLAGVPLDRGRPPGVMTEDRSGRGRLARRLFFLVDPQRRARGVSRLINPVMAKEFRTRRFGRGHWTLRLIAGTAVLSLGLSYLATAGALDWGVEAIGGALVVLQTALLLLFAPSLAAGLISTEVEAGGWGLLRTTPLSPGAILRGKLMSVAWPLILLLGGTLPGYVVLMTVLPEMAGQVQRVVACLAATAVFTVLLSAAAGSLFRTTAAATAAAYLAVIAVCVLPLLVWLGRDAPFGHSTVVSALTISPVAAALSAAETPGFAAYRLVPANWWFVGSASVVLLVFLWVRVRQLYRPE
jgi:ABC-type transport system involved in multi-copper enzyme maturation permease subunit